MEKIKIVQTKTKEDCVICDNLSTSLINYEATFDNVISNSFVVNGWSKNQLDKEDVYLAYAFDNQPCGYIFGFLKNPKGKVSTTNVLELEGVFVEDDYRNKGVGKLLLMSFENWAKEKFGNDYIIEITYLNSNEKAKQFYEHMGYKPVKTILRK